ncbi:hypothetical protein [Chitinophaga ginsengisoli]|uniref:Uncharacterized protein n=1 Tax=Chitinophaga ginsengisoli TaxID=363837 RepID=A0A2P8G2F0_9BACT|nr:hypothetical protein [Chitinophaga ginsengisoli]PSL28158.1 hypothetical protein CLV42_10877 [Chitinophaga ginsengisoli]
MTTLEKSQFLENVLTCLAIMIGGVWTFWRFILNGDGKPKIQFDIDLRVVGRQDSKILIEAIATVHNKGQVRHIIKNFLLDILILKKNEPIINGDDFINYQIFLKKFNPEKVNPEPPESENRIVWVPRRWYKTFIDAGIAQKYTYLTYVPEDTTFVSLYSRFYFNSFFSFKKDFQSVQKTFNVTKMEESL